MATSGVQGWPERLWRVFGDGDVQGAYRPNLRALSVVQAEASQFGESLVAERTPIIELNSSYGTSRLRDQVTEENGATEALNVSGEIQLQTGTNANGRVLVESAEIGRYMPGFGAEIGVGLRFATAPTGSQEVRVGGLAPDGNDGLYFLRDAAGYAVVRLNGGVENIVRQADWNIDKLDGTGPSEVTLSDDKGKIFQIDFTWYGYGAIVYGVVDTVQGGGQRFIPCHRFEAFDDTSLRSPNLRVSVEAKNGGTTGANLDVRLGGRQYSIVGRYIPRFRVTGDRREGVSVGTTVRPLISFRRKAAFNDRSVKLSGYTLVNTGNAPVFVEIRVLGTLTGASFGTPSNQEAAETALEADIAATAITGGVLMWAGDIVGAGQNSNPSVDQKEVDLDIPDEATVSLCVATFSGTTTIASGFRMREEW